MPEMLPVLALFGITSTLAASSRAVNSASEGESCTAKSTSFCSRCLVEALPVRSACSISPLVGVRRMASRLGFTAVSPISFSRWRMTASWRR